MNPIQALWCAFWGVSLDHFPRVSCNGSERSIPTEKVIEMIVSELCELKLSEDDKKVDGVSGLIRQSLDEVKALTEYQDAKATKLLTILSFLSALAALLFGRMLDTFPIEDLISRPSISWSSDLLILTAYLAGYLPELIFRPSLEGQDLGDLPPERSLTLM